MQIIGESIRGRPSGCLIEELGALDCRKGCDVCHFNEMFEKMKNYFPNKEEGPGKEI